MSGDGIQVIREGRPLFAQIPYDVVRNGSLGHTAFRLRVVLESYADFQERDCYPTIGTLAKDCGCSRSTIERATRELVKAGLLRVESGRSAGHANVYVVIDPPGSNRGRSSTSDVGGTSPVTQGGTSPVTHRTRTSKRDPKNEESSRHSSLALVSDPAPFEDFWETYPRRNGKRVGKADAARVYNRLSLADRRLAMAGVVHYAAACEGRITIAKDAHRWLTHKCWVDWQTPATPEPRRNPLSRGGPSLGDLHSAALAAEQRKSQGVL